MASSPLTMAMLGGGNSNLALQDPATLAAARRLALGESMATAGLDASPAYPAQALSRLGQALLGSYVLNKGYGELGDIQKARQGEVTTGLQNIWNMGNAPATPTTAPVTTPPSQPVATGGLPGAVHQLESSGAMTPGITGDGGAAAGPMQVHQAALTDVNRAQGTNYTMDQITADPVLGKKVGDAYLGLQQQRFPGRPDLALAAYNAGPTATANVEASGQGVAGLPAAAQSYVQRGLQMAGADQPTTGAAQPQGAGLDNSHVRTTMDQMRAVELWAARNPYNAAVQEAAKMEMSRLNTVMGLDSYSVAPNGIATNLRTGKPESGAVPTPHYVQTAPGVWTDTSGSHPPTFQPPGNIRFNPATGEGIATTSAGPKSIGMPDLGAVAGLRSAQAQGTKTGEQAAVTVDRMEKLGTESAMQLNTIDSAIGQLREARSGGVNTGYFAPWLAEGAAMAKNLGINLAPADIDPSAVSNIQAARKSLAIVGGGIIRSILGPGSDVTDAKMNAFIHATPGIETDPGAIEKILGWARSQALFGHDMAMDAMRNANPDTGMVPPGWRARYFSQKGSFGPIYNPLSGHLAQPEGEGPPREAPAATAPVQPAQATQQPTAPEKTIVGPNGEERVVRGGKWVPK